MTLPHNDEREAKRQKRTRNDEEGGQALEVLMRGGQALEDLMRPWIATHVEERSSSICYSLGERVSQPMANRTKYLGGGVSQPSYQIVQQKGPL